MTSFTTLVEIVTARDAGRVNARIAVPGATGRTGRFVLAELDRRGLTPVPCARDTDLDRAFGAVDAVINCAGPFAETAEPVLAAAIRAGVPYLDVTAELEVIGDTFARHAGAPIPVVPAVAFFGGLGDLLATAALGGATTADRIVIGYDLSDWHPTHGTRATGRVSAERRGGRRVVHTGGRLRYRDGAAPRTQFPFAGGRRAVVGEFTMADSATIPTHIEVPEIETYMNTEAVDDLHADDPAGPVPVDASGRSAQTFHVEVIAHSGGVARRASASGRDIYAVTAPLVVEAAVRLLAGEGAKPGVACAGARFDAREFLRALTPDHLAATIPDGAAR
ncbi:saccharopine dehydrogenase NADP-binding domain-containing protein [Phytohabitans houttuyneae]|uniref:Saccharopine dehydrogenase n=1 Tax=Phytohabitans houttuyneae TaxID=1076126 RepID=A0A6V8KLF0_9ACTN|nr:saccharopine dehydrogenase [Phytohabitans houttuyneae]